MGNRKRNKKKAQKKAEQEREVRAEAEKQEAEYQDEKEDTQKTSAPGAIFIKFLDGVTLRLNVNFDESVADVKNMIQVNFNLCIYDISFLSVLVNEQLLLTT